MPFSPTQPVSRKELIDKVTQLFGLKEDDELRAVALQFLDDSVKEMNSYLFEFNKRVLSGISLTANTQEYELDGSPYKEVQAYLVDSNSNREPPMYYLPYVQFIRMYSGTSNYDSHGPPYAYTFRNVEDDGKLWLYPKPSQSDADSYTLTVEYYTRVPLPSELSDEDKKLDVPQEVENSLIFAAQKRLAIHLNGPSHPDVSALDALENRALQRLIAIDRHHPDSQTRFRIQGLDRRGRLSRGGGRLFIEI